KPENILVVRDQVRVLDFGLSIRREAANGEAGFAGTLRYMAPEILRGEAPTEACDLYALGMIAHELFTGSYPFQDTSPVRLAEQIMGMPLPRSDEPVDPRLRPVLERLLAKDPQARYRDATEVIVTLAAALDQVLPVETVATRESFLQSAPLVGRREELARLT